MSVMTGGPLPSYKLDPGTEQLNPAERAARGKQARAALPMARNLAATPACDTRPG